jgi:dTMP kinase
MMFPLQYSAPFIVFEGLDGSGKSSLMNLLEYELRQRGKMVLRTREPGGTWLGDQIRKLLLDKGDHAPMPRAELLLYEASRAQHVDQKILPALREGQWVLCDRFTASSLAFQAGGRKISQDWVSKLNLFATNGLDPSLTVLLDLSVDEARKRRTQRQVELNIEEDRMESESASFHEAVRRSFLLQAEAQSKSWLVLDASGSLEKQHQILLQALSERRWLD